MEFVKAKSLFDLSNIIDTDIEDHKSPLCFRESLIISKLNSHDTEEQPTPMGGMCIDVQCALDNKFVVYVSTKFNVKDSTGGSKITAWVDPFFYTIEEKRVEFIVGPEEQEKQTLYIGSGKDGVLVSHTLNEDAPTKRLYSPNITNTLICEGANFLVMRLLALKLFEGAFEMSATYINGDLCRNIYQCTGVIPAKINGVKTEAIKIMRTVIEECGIKHFQTTVITSTGHIVKQEWDNCDYVIQLNPLQDPLAFAISGAACGCENVLSLVGGWQEDLELMSIYLDRRKLCQFKNQDYMADTPEITDILADYVKTLLQNKPDKVLEFTSDYFMRYSSS